MTCLHPNREMFTADLDWCPDCYEKLEPQSTSKNVIHFNSQIQFGASVDGFSQDVIKNEPMLYNCDLRNAMLLGGPITNAFLVILNKEFFHSSDLVIDSRVHMLMPGWYPCIPGFHCDDVPRERSDGQPNHVNPSYKSKHCMMLCGDASRTEFALGKFSLEEVPIGKKVYEVWHPQVEDKLIWENFRVKSYKAEENKLIYFDSDSWHQGCKATKSGWRFFIRATVNTKRKPTNELRRQTQVYLENTMEGW